MNHSDCGDLRQDILNAAAQAASGERKAIPVPLSPVAAAGSNQFLFFLKPEMLMAPRSAEAIDLALEQIAAYGLTIEALSVVPGAYLAEHGIMAAHYGVINRLANDPHTHLSHSARETFEKTFGKPTESARLLGAFEYLRAHAPMDEEQLQSLWLSKDYVKLGGGAYCICLAENGTETFLVNGFHPKQLAHFTAPGRAIVVMTLRGALPWKEARNDFLGATDPARAKAGSLRQQLYARRDELGVMMTGGMNGTHLSAGPVEGLVELRRFSPTPRPVTDFVFGQRLAETFDEPRIEWLLSNPTVSFEGKPVPVFDLTEELDPDRAMVHLEQVAGQSR